MRWVVLGAVGLLIAGVGLVALSLAEGGASVALLVIVPVVSGSSLTFLLGVGLLFAGFLALPFAVAAGWGEGPPSEGPSSLPSSATAPPRGRGGVGGFVLIGPVPIVFGSWRGISRRTRWLLALGGAILLTAVLVVLVWLLV